MKWSWSVALLCALPAQGTTYTLDIEPEVQQYTELCWAAVSVMATRAFPAAGKYRPATQEEIVIYKKANIGTLAASLATEPQQVVDARAFCGVAYANCNKSEQPWLLGLKRNQINEVTPGVKNMLTENHFLIDIAQREVPIIIRWDYVPVAASGTRGEEDFRPARGGMHSLIVTGYDDEAHEIRVWDPWPADNQTAPSGHLRHKWITMNRYAHPVSDNGYLVKSQHAYDQYAIRRRGRAIHSGYGDLVAVPPPPVQVIAPIPVDIGGGVPNLRDEIGNVMGNLVVRAENGSILQGPFEAGSPFPILALSSAQIDGDRARIEALFRPQTSAMVVPVTKDGRVVDSFLLLNQGGRWVEGGYSNNQIAKLLVDVRRDKAGPQRAAAGFYLVSIPEEGSFFAAHGFKDQAALISLDYGARGDFVRAKQALTPLLGQIDRRKNSDTGHVVRPQ